MLTTLPPALAAFRGYRQFCLYALRPGIKPGKLDKIPCDRNGLAADAHAPATWMDADEALAAAQALGLGVGFVFADSDPFWFLDIDGAWDGAAWSPLAQQLCRTFAGCAVEVSTSGGGLHIFGTGAVPAHTSRNTAAGLELYTSRRFVALTGTHATGDAAHAARPEALQWLVDTYFRPAAGASCRPAEWTDGPCPEWRGPTDDADLLRRARRSVSGRAALGLGASFDDLWEARPDALAAAYSSDSDVWNRSSADAALASHLAFWTGRDCERIERLMRQSALAREKWEREDYLPRTILAACSASRDVLQDKPIELPPDPEADDEPPPASRLIDSKAFVGVEEQVEMFGGCVYVASLHRVLMPTGELLKPEAFKVRFGRYKFVKDSSNGGCHGDAWEAFTASTAVQHRQASDVCFRPDLPLGAFVKREGRYLVNTYRPAGGKRAVGDPSPFLRHLEKLIPDDRDRAILMAYFAACVQYPGRKFKWAPVIQGVEGNGKTTLSRCVAYAIGKPYVHWPKASKLGAQFNSWMYGNLLYCVEDMYAPRGVDIVEELKPMITGEDLEIEGKGVDQATRDVCGNFIFNANGRAAIRKTRNDRRYAVFYCAQQAADDLRRDGLTEQYMGDLHDWLAADGFGVVATLLDTWPIPDELNPATRCVRAPVTSSTEQAISNSYSPMEQSVIEAIEEERPGFKGGWVSGTRLADYLHECGYKVTPHQRDSLMEGLRYVRHPGLPGGRVNNPVLPDARRSVLYVSQLHGSMTLGTPAEIAAAYESANKA